MSGTKKFASEALQYAYDRIVAGDAEQESFYEESLFGTEVATMIHSLRSQARLSQRALAEKVGTTASVICRLEDADYEGHSLAMLRRVAAALGRRVEVRFVPVARRKGSRRGKVA